VISNGASQDAPVGSTLINCKSCKIQTSMYQGFVNKRISIGDDADTVRHPAERNHPATIGHLIHKKRLRTIDPERERERGQLLQPHLGHSRRQRAIERLHGRPRQIREQCRRFTNEFPLAAIVKRMHPSPIIFFPIKSRFAAGSRSFITAFLMKAKVSRMHNPLVNQHQRQHCTVISTNLDVNDRWSTAWTLQCG
jgi:hypothetical protein